RGFPGVEGHEAERAVVPREAAADDHEAPTPAVRGDAGRHDEQSAADDVADAEHEPDLGRIRAERLQEEWLDRADEAEAETPEDLDGDQEADVARQGQRA